VITKPRRLWFAAAAAAVACLAWTAAASAAGTTGGLPAIQGPLLSTLSGSGSAVSHPCLFTALFGFDCYGPYELGKAYNFPTNLDGTGQTIVIVDAYGSPTIQSDLAAFDSYFHIPAPPSFTIINAASDGETGSGALTSWGVETSLDVEYAHAMAPGAKIVLDVAANDANDNIAYAEAQVLPFYPGALVSQSFGDWETDSTTTPSYVSTSHQIYQMATSLGDTIFASAGDAGATWTQYTGTTSPVIASYPASDPLNTAVGGTQGNPYPGGLYVNGGYGGEQVWNEGAFGIDAATGGAPSILFGAPSWQRGVTGYSTRTIPDVSYDAAVNGGVEVFASPFIYLVGGTSVGSPQWAAIFALLNQARAAQGDGPIGFANADLYHLGRDQSTRSNVFHDITVGNNALDSSLGFSAGTGYDLATGWGTPNVSNLIQALLKAPSDHHGDGGDQSGDGKGGGGDHSGSHGGHQHDSNTAIPG